MKEGGGLIFTQRWGCTLFSPVAYVGSTGGADRGSSSQFELYRPSQVPRDRKDALKCNIPPYTEAIGHCCYIPALDPPIASCCGGHRALPKPCVSPSSDFSKPRSNCTQDGSGLSLSGLASCRSHFDLCKSKQYTSTCVAVLNHCHIGVSFCCSARGHYRTFSKDEVFVPFLAGYRQQQQYRYTYPSLFLSGLRSFADSRTETSCPAILL